ncbi:MAG: large conductance mechanosensitive channel protein MscL [Clostridiales Family XIII bacterium]|nr:large conductance mechanosensitive channel protein MscL [Clostridiales Family XIII bacterium]
MAKRKEKNKAIRSFTEKIKKPGIIQEFKDFAIRGNMIDMAVGVVIGAAFTTLIKSFVENILTPIIGAVTAHQNFDKLQLKIGSVDFTYGTFIQVFINFILTALAVFLFVKIISAFRRKKDDEGEPEAPTETDLLIEIRDLLKEKDHKDA